MNSHDALAGPAPLSVLPKAHVRISPWVNERPPPWRDILTAHDVTRLTRRSHTTILALTLIGRFPGKQRFQGRNVGWLRSDILDWMTRSLRVEPATTTVNGYFRHRANAPNRRGSKRRVRAYGRRPRCALSRNRQLMLCAMWNSDSRCNESGPDQSCEVFHDQE